MLSALLFAIGAASFLSALWPFGPHQLALIVARRRCCFSPTPDPARIVPGRNDDSFAVRMCAYNEAPIIADKIEDLLSLREAAGADPDS